MRLCSVEQRQAQGVEMHFLKVRLLEN